MNNKQTKNKVTTTTITTMNEGMQKERTKEQEKRKK